MLGIGESTGWYAFQNPLSLTPAEAPASEGDSDSVAGVKLDLETGLVPKAEESIESFRLLVSDSGAVESLARVVGLGWSGFQRSLVSSKTSAPIAEKAAE